MKCLESRRQPATSLTSVRPWFFFAGHLHDERVTRVPFASASFAWSTRRRALTHRIGFVAWVASCLAWHRQCFSAAGAACSGAWAVTVHNSARNRAAGGGHFIASLRTALVAQGRLTFREVFWHCTMRSWPLQPKRLLCAIKVAEPKELLTRWHSPRPSRL
jgi:hypothetical protein